MVETKVVKDPKIMSTEQKRNGFHCKYLKLCKSKNLIPVPEVKAKQTNYQALEFHADRIRPQDWLAICSSLHSDKTLKFVAIRLRRNHEMVLEEMDTLKKAQSIETHPVIYSKFLFSLLVDALQNLLANSNTLETLVLEGLPLNGRYMLSITKGLSQNNSLTTLSLTRSQIGDEACDFLCSTVKHMEEIHTLILSGCNLSFKGVEAVASLIKFQKIKRFSEAWAQSLRYQNIDSDMFHGLRKISLNNNPEIENEGLDVILDSLFEDAWIKEVEMQNCGLSDEGALKIIKCLDINKSILSFNISGNPDVSEHLHRQILINLGNIAFDNSDSSDSKYTSEKMTKAKLMENFFYIQEQLEAEIFRRKKTELLNETLNKQLTEAQNELMIQGAVRVPEGFTLVSNEILNEILDRKSKDCPSKVIRTRRNHRRSDGIRRTRSDFISKSKIHVKKISRSEHRIEADVDKPDFVENSIGDTAKNSELISDQGLFKMFAKKKQVQPPSEEPLNLPLNGNLNSCKGCTSMSSAELLRMFSKKNKNNHPSETSFASKMDPRDVFKNPVGNVPKNSVYDSDSSSNQQA